MDQPSEPHQVAEGIGGCVRGYVVTGCSEADLLAPAPTTIRSCQLMLYSCSRKVGPLGSADATSLVKSMPLPSLNVFV